MGRDIATEDRAAVRVFPPAIPLLIIVAGIILAKLQPIDTGVEVRPVVRYRGPFHVTRNPMYLLMLLACVGFAILLANLWILILTPVCGWLLYKLAIQHEEAYLERKFGDVYRSYKARVRRWI